MLYEVITSDALRGIMDCPDDPGDLHAYTSWIPVINLESCSLAIVAPAREVCRITSYNVCYTKLLRVEMQFEKGEIRAVVTTAALAAGVDFPASQVIFDSLA